MEVYVNVSEIKTADEPKEAHEATVPTAGCERVTDADIDALLDQLEEAMAEHGIHYLFAEGMHAALCFVACPEGEDMHGKPLGEFAVNSWEQASSNFILDNVLDFLTGGTR